MSGVLGIDHVNLRASPHMLERLRRFYIDVIGLREGHRPTFRSGSIGHWLYAGEQPVMHLSASHAPHDDEAVDTGRFDHFALACNDLHGMRARLDAAHIAYRIDDVAALEQVQIFLLDPAGVGVELNFSGARDIVR